MSDSVAATAAPIVTTAGQITEVATPEAAPVVEVPKKEDDFLAPKFAALTRKEKAIRAQESAIRAREADLNKRMAELEARSNTEKQNVSTFETEFKKNPLKTMQKYGVTFDQLTEMQLNEQNPTTEMMIERLRAELDEKYSKELNGVKESLKEKEERQAAEAYQAAVESYKTEINQFIGQNPDAYELIVANGATDLMFETAEVYYQTTGKVPSLEEVAQAVESHLEEEANKIFKLKKFQTAKPEASTAVKPAQTAPTLSNTLAAQVPKSGTKQLSDEQSKREAAKLLRWE